VRRPASARRIRRHQSGVIRTVNAVLFFDINTAMALHDWLGQRIKAFKDAHPEIFKDGQQ
jgi:hypothetical protein